MLLYPFEEKFDLPSVFVKQCHIFRSKIKIVGKEDEPFFCFFINEFYSAEAIWIFFRGIEAFEVDSLITEYAFFLFHFP